MLGLQARHFDSNEGRQAWVETDVPIHWAEVVTLH